MSDLVENLNYAFHSESIAYKNMTLRMAANEIERLQAQVAALREALEPFVRALQMQEAENEIKGFPLPNDTNRLRFAFIGDARRAHAALATGERYG